MLLRGENGVGYKNHPDKRPFPYRV